VVPAIEIRGVSKTYGSVRALCDIDLEIPQGEFFALLGPNGAGKTTLISMLAGLARANAGSLKVMGHDVVADYRQARRALGVVPQASGSWFLPLLHERIESETTPSAKLAGQLKELCPLLAEQSPGRPLGLFDSEFGSGIFLNQTEKIDCDLLFRVKPNRKTPPITPTTATKKTAWRRGWAKKDPASELCWQKNNQKSWH